MKGFKYLNKNTNGITLIALTVTIIVILILAGVTISIVIDDGILNKAKTSTDLYQNQMNKEKNMIDNIRNEA